MKEPKIDGTLISEIYKYSKEKSLVELFCLSDADDEEKSLVKLLPTATAWDFKRADDILSECIGSGRMLQAHYYAINEREPKGELVGSITDGSLWVV